MNKRKLKKFNKKLKLKKHVSERLYDRDKNTTYIPNDESLIEVVTDKGVIEVFHPSHKNK